MAPTQLDNTCHIGVDTVIWPFASVIRCAWIGAGCVVGSNAVVDGAVVGDRSRIGHGAFICPGVHIGREVFVGPYVIFTNDRWPRVAKDGFNMEALINGTVRVAIVDDGASIGAGALILPGVRIGKGALVSAGCVVERDVSDGFLLQRSGRGVPIDPDRMERMRVARGLLPLAAE